jgi:hypothetical protein
MERCDRVCKQSFVFDTIEKSTNSISWRFLYEEPTLSGLSHISEKTEIDSSSEMPKNKIIFVKKCCKEEFENVVVEYVAAPDLISKYR